MTLMERGLEPSVSLIDLLAGRTDSIEGDTTADLTTYVDEILTGGFPALRRLSGRALRAQLNGYLQRVIDRDFPEQGIDIRRPDSLRAWMAAYAAATATTASYEVIRDAATPGEGDKPAKTTTMPYRDILTRLWLLDPVEAWLPTNNPFKRLGASSKHHLADPALAARLLGVTKSQLLTGESAGPVVPRVGTQLGALFESLIALNVRVYAQSAEAEVRHLRTAGGEHEVDFIIVGQGGGIVAVEVKLSANIDERDVKHLLWLRDHLGDELRAAVVVTTGRYAYKRQDGICVVPAALFGP
jgi:predicted AAA+ superfamily ATPase